MRSSTAQADISATAAEVWAALTSPVDAVRLLSNLKTYLETAQLRPGPSPT